VDVATIANVQIDGLPFDAVVDAVVARAAAGGPPSYVVTPNAHHVMLLQSDALLREIYEEAYVVVPDGVPLLWAAKLLGQPLNGRVNGTDLFEALCARAAGCGLRVFLLGGREGAAESAAGALKARHPSLNICGTACPPHGFDEDPFENDDLVEQVRVARPDLLFVGLGAPKQEYWMYRNRERLGVPVSLGIGVSFEFVGGVVRRAPAWMQRAGLEWFHRITTEPARLWRRYLFGNSQFCALVARQYVAQRFGRRPRGR
jgi:N-acetylglucosaminyldiphosphoundecaprenol N-acetyl-beta-D-mannosaminyltransferase